MKLKYIVWAVLLAGAGFAAYKMLQKKKKTRLVKDRSFEFEVEEDDEA